MFGVQFYPTPERLADRMLEKVDWTRVKYALEPSAGKGDLVRAILRNAKASNRVKHMPVDCCEIDGNLISVLQGNGMTVVQDDFLHYEPMTRYDLIVMNPPFANGDIHLLHALDLLKDGGQCVCLLNANTLNNMDSPIRKDLLSRFTEYDADIEIIENAFRQAERKAGVDVAMIYVDIPRKENNDVLNGLKSAQTIFSHSDDSINDLMGAENPFQAAVDRFRFEAELGLKIINDFENSAKYFTEITRGVVNPRTLIALDIYGDAYSDHKDREMSKQNLYLRELRGLYWQRFFGMPELKRMLTEDVAQKYTSKLNEFKAIDFTMRNIHRIQLELSQNLLSSMEDAILKGFETLTYEHSLGKNTNVHYYSGWATNSAYRIKPKVIIPCWGMYDNRYGFWEAYRCLDKLEELEKILNFLDSGRTDGSSIRDEWERQFDHHSYGGERISFKFFDIELKKKGTVHLWFKDLELLKRWNVYAGMKKNYIPPEYGRKAYHEMTDRERKVVDAFEGKQEYEKTMQNPRFYIGGANLLALTEENAANI